MAPTTCVDLSLNHLVPSRNRNVAFIVLTPNGSRRAATFVRAAIAFVSEATAKELLVKGAAPRTYCRSCPGEILCTD